jgi:hypothetical protein
MTINNRKTKRKKNSDTNNRIYKKNNYTRKQKKQISDKIYDLTDKDVMDDYNKLCEIGCNYHKELSNYGNKVVNKYTLVERLNTKGKQNVTFYDLYQNRSYFKKKPYVKKIINFYKKNRKNYDEAKIFFRLSNLYFTAISIFKPLIAMRIYCEYKPTSILDFTMGWGGRLVGACALNIPKYIGIDNNKNLKTPYNNMSSFLHKHSTTKIDLYFQDALDVDYSKLDYDFVLTSPPYYNIEIYGDVNVDVNDKAWLKTKEEWNNDFYIPIFERTFQYLKKGGHYCLNISNELYENVAIKVLGKANKKIPMPKYKRSFTKNYTEFIYIWQKSHL